MDNPLEEVAGFLDLLAGKTVGVQMAARIGSHEDIGVAGFLVGMLRRERDDGKSPRLMTKVLATAFRQTWDKAADRSGGSHQLWKCLRDAMQRLKKVSEDSIWSRVSEHLRGKIVEHEASLKEEVDRDLEEQLHELRTDFDHRWVTQVAEVGRTWTRSSIGRDRLVHSAPSKTWTEALDALDELLGSKFPDTSDLRSALEETSLGDCLADRLLDRLRRATSLAERLLKLAKVEPSFDIVGAVEKAKDSLMTPGDLADRFNSFFLVRLCLAVSSTKDIWGELLPPDCRADNEEWTVQLRAGAPQSKSIDGVGSPIVGFSELEWLYGKLQIAVIKDVPSIPMTFAECMKLLGVPRKSLTRWLKSIETKAGRKKWDITIEMIEKLMTAKGVSKTSREKHILPALRLLKLKQAIQRPPGAI